MFNINIRKRQIERRARVCMCGISGTPGDCIIMYFIRRAPKRVPTPLSAKVLMIKIFYEAWEIRRKDIHGGLIKTILKFLRLALSTGGRKKMPLDMRATAAALHNFIAPAGSCMCEMEK